MSHSDVRLHIATAADVERLLDLMQAFNREEQIAWARETARPALRQLLDASEVGALGLLLRRGTALGYGMLSWGFDMEWPGRDAFLTELYLVPEVRCQGLGRVLLALLEDYARSQGACVLQLLVRPDNAPAQRLYARAGFRPPSRTYLLKPLRER